MMEKETFKLIHVAQIYTDEGYKYLFLRKINFHEFGWFEEKEGKEIPTPIVDINIEEAIRLASHHWKSDFFQTLNCGFRYTLPERDEHGMNALFHQMAASNDTINGIYYDEELGNNCFIQNAPATSRQLAKRLKAEGRI